jgi:hypothetical protein
MLRHLGKVGPDLGRLLLGNADAQGLRDMHIRTETFTPCAVIISVSFNREHY